MSLARVYTTKGPVRKDGLKCGKCGDPIRKGQDRRITFAVGFRGYEQTRCTKPECFPTTAERESSLVSTIYSAIESNPASGIEEWDDFIAARDEIVAACEEVADEYESNEMYDINYDLQERADRCREAGQDLENWEPENDAPDQEDDATWGDHDNYEDAVSEWIDETRESFDTAVGDLDI